MQQLWLLFTIAKRESQCTVFDPDADPDPDPDADSDPAQIQMRKYRSAWQRRHFV